MTRSSAASGSSPSRPRPNDRRRQARPAPRELLDAAISLFYEKGYAHTTLQDIADRMGFTKAAIYYYAKNKEELLVEIYVAIVEPAIADARELAARPAPDGATQFVALIEQHLQTFLHNVEANAVFEVQNFSLSAPAKQRIQSLAREYDDVLLEVYDAGIADGSIAPAIRRSRSTRSSACATRPIAGTARAASSAQPGDRPARRPSSRPASAGPLRRLTCSHRSSTSASSFPSWARPMRDLSSTMGLTWASEQRRAFPITLRGETVERDIQFVYSVTGPPYVELIGANEPPWSAQDGLHHMGIWSEDVVGDIEKLVGRGLRGQRHRPQPQGLRRRLRLPRQPDRSAAGAGRLSAARRASTAGSPAATTL